MAYHRHASFILFYFIAVYLQVPDAFADILDMPCFFLKVIMEQLSDCHGDWAERSRPQGSPPVKRMISPPRTRLHDMVLVG